MTDHDATYSPEDNKLRMYPAYRLDKEDYYRFKNLGFKWAPKQELFVAPMWTPAREDLLIEFCGEIGDEDTSLVERAEIRSERFTDYSSKRAQDAESAHDAVKSITDHTPLGQPILVGHHSEKRARKDAERIENGMRKAVKMWETSKYWEDRAAGALGHAKYLERPDVRARRIKKLEAGKRKQEKNIKTCKDELNMWLAPFIFSRSRALAITNYSACHYSFCFSLDKYPRNPPASQYEGSMGLWSALDGGVINHKQARNLAVPNLERSMAYAARWLNHFENRLIYEKAMLGEQGKLDLIKKKPRPKQLPLLNYRSPDGIEIENNYHRGEFIHYDQIEMTKAEYKQAYNKGTRTVENSHRVRVYAKHWNDNLVVFLTDSKVHKKPKPEPAPEPKVDRLVGSTVYQPPERTKFDDMKDTLREGIKTVVAPQLFPTPHDIAEKMVEYADIEPGDRVLEPSAGTGNIISNMGAVWHENGGSLTAVEINGSLCDNLRVEYPLTKVENADFLSCNGDLGTFDRIVMNPPFVNGSDIKHINHALTFLKPGGRLVALCANGPRQRDAFMNLAEHWEDLPPDSFKDQGTRVNVALMVLTN